jgi:hypothetical protein
MSGLMGPSDVAGSTYKTPGRGVGIGVDVGKDVAVGGRVAVGVPGVGVAGGAACPPQAERSRVKAINGNSVGRMFISMENDGSFILLLLRVDARFR